MFELLSLISIVLAISAFSGMRGVRGRFDTEINALKAEIDRLKAAGPLPAAEQLEPEPVSADMTAVEGANPPEPALEPAEVAASLAQTPDTAAEVAAEQPQAAETLAATGELPVQKPRESLESTLAARWSVWVGGLALAFAGIFAVKYSIDQGLLSPAVRLSLAGLFGLVLMAVGEWVRRRTEPLVANTFQNAMIPGILTAAGSLTLMGAIFVAHGIYDYFGPGTAFFLLAVVSFATLALSLLHGQALAGLGLLASFVTPLLVTSTSPQPWPLFGFLTTAWIGSTLASRIRAWKVAPAIANSGLSLWVAAYVMGFDSYETAPATLPLLVMIAGLAFLWPGKVEHQSVAAIAVEPEIEMMPAPEIADAAGPAGPVPLRPRAPSRWEGLFLPVHLASTLTAALGVLMAAVFMVSPDVVSAGYADYAFVILVASLGLFGALRSYAIYPAIFAALAALGGFRVMSMQTASGSFVAVDPAQVAAYIDPYQLRTIALLLGLVFAFLSLFVLERRRRDDGEFAASWAVIGTVTPLVLGALSFLYLGNYDIDWVHGLYGLVLAVLYLAAVWRFFSPAEFDGRYVVIREILLAASWASLVFVLMVTTNGIATTLGAALLGFLYVLASLRKDWPSLPWGMILSAVFVAGRIAWDPTIVGPDNLSTTPIFNALLAGYGLPTLALIASAWLIRNRNDDRLRNVMEALASLFSLLTLAILVRHAMNGGVLNSAVPTLGEQAIYTLLTVGASATLMTLDLRRPSIVFRTGSMAVGYLSMASVLFAHYFGLNPFITGELTGKIVFFNLLFLAYLLPAIAYGGAAWYARDRRPYHYVVALALTGASLAFAYVTLSVRRFFHGEGIAEWKGFLQSELYTYSVVWLLLGVALLVAGYRFKAKSIRIASAVLVLIAVLKVFLIDMANLEGLYRVLSFVGLGIALIGIGRFYQTVLSGLEAQERAVPVEASETPAA